MWQHIGQRRPPFALEPGPGQESVWNYPRPPRLAPQPGEVVVRFAELEIARSTRAVRVLETASPPTVYLPPEDVNAALLVPAAGGSFCEWKGEAAYWTVRDRAGHEVRDAGWSYPQPTPAFAAIAGWLSFYPAKLECFIDGERVRAQGGGFYGGWVTDRIVGPWKGEAGTGGW